MLQVALAALTIQGLVVADQDGDGAHSAGDVPVAGAVVAWEGSVFATTDEGGRFTLEAPRGGIVWVRSPEGYAPGPTWQEVGPAGGEVTLVLRPHQPAGPLTFVHASDTHVGTNDTEETRRALLQAARSDPAPWFLVVTGDLTAGTQPKELEDLHRARRALEVPFVPVLGNHDWHDGGALYRQHFGPPMYSFDAGGVRFLVLDFMTNPRAQLEFVARDLAHGPRPRLVAAFIHGPPDDAQTRALARSGVRYLFSGHAHNNRLLERQGLVEVNTQPAVMGGLDYAPAGYRVVRLAGGRFEFDHHTVVRQPVVAITYPREGACVPPGDLEVIAAIELGHRPRTIELSDEGGAAIPVVHRGGWTYVGTTAVSAPGPHRITLRTTDAQGRVHSTSAQVCVRTETAAPLILGDWPQLQGSSVHHGFTEAEIPAPLASRWAHAVGGHIRGAPVAAGGRVFVPIVDLGDTRAGGLVALDAATGRRLWEHRGEGSITASPAVADDLVVYATTDGWLHARAAGDGSPRWKVHVTAGVDDLESTINGAPVIAAGRVFVGVPKRFVAVELATGRIAGSFATASIPVPLHASAAVSDDRGLVPLGRGKGSLVGFDPHTLEVTWIKDIRPASWIQPAPILAGATAYVGNAEEIFLALDAASGDERWAGPLYDSHSWAMWSLATPALARETLYVATPRTHLYAVDAKTGKVRWKRAAGPGPTHPVPYQRQARGFLASPVVTGDTLWAGGMDGVLRAYDPGTGRERWSTDLTTPIVGGLVPAGQHLLVATYDGTVHALAPTGEPLPERAGNLRLFLAALAALATMITTALLLRRRRQRNTPPRPR